ncbi:hypothetical protein G352_03741 [Rhodococcus ruber BKS 20-38]|uniref:Peptide chain release factor 1 n=1 Tax=Rhodococcus ruber BKS 20-38 TaxID=1278076 RepID=M2Y0K2_9NOCA|nr:hypothetical protein [Rhodococcus ruber]EME66681.1 hypothetical protein G352_03741 [Rhodococcus ruber BKS 20-38]
MHADRFADFTTASGPFASVYYEDSHATEDAAKVAELTWRSISEQLERLGTPQAVLDNVERAVTEAPTAVGSGGRAIVANPEGVLVHERLVRPPLRTEVRLSDMPYLLPLVEHGTSGRPYLVAAVDHAGGDLTVYDRHGGVLHEETVTGEGYPIHKAAGAQSPGYGDPEPNVEEQRRRNIAVVADRITELVDEHHADPVFVIGEVRSRTDLAETVPQRTGDVLVQVQTGSRAEGSDRERVRQSIQEELAQRRLVEMDDAAERYRAGAGTGLAVEGSSEVTAALRERRVDTLILGDLDDTTVLVGDDPSLVAADAGALSEMGSGSERVCRADEALPFAAVATGATVLRMDERLTPADGIGALLRY